MCENVTLLKHAGMKAPRINSLREADFFSGGNNELANCHRGLMRRRYSRSCCSVILGGKGPPPMHLHDRDVKCFEFVVYGEDK